MPPPTDPPTTYDPATLPPYLSALCTSLILPPSHPPIPFLSLPQIRGLTSRAHQHLHLLLLRHHLTALLSTGGLQPATLLRRARVYEALGYPELAAGDAYAAFTVAEYEEEGEGEGDLVGCWEGSEEERGRVVRGVKRRAVGVLGRCLQGLGCEEEVRVRWEGIERGLRGEDGGGGEGEGQDDGDDDDGDGEGWCMFRPDEVESLDEAFHYGLSRREVYPWNTYEGDRMSESALREINQRLQTASEGQLVAKKTILPDVSLKTASLEDQAANLDVNGESENAQLGLFTACGLPPNAVILNERSALTAIRPHGEALCDACAGDLSDLPSSARQLCPGCGIPFCSAECLSVALKTYHAPNTSDDETDEGFPPAATPFCPGSSGEADIANLGRAESSDTPEWDLYFLLVTRALQMAETLDCHPLEIWECKYLWGSFEASISPESLTGKAGAIKLKRTLPFSLRHHVELPLQWFELLLLSRAESAPYTSKWVDRYDWWVIQTLYAKFRGVADARLSSWTGEPETAGVFPLWCLANHSCEAGVTWEGGGVRRLRVRKERVVRKEGEETAEWEGLRAGEEVWNHYTDVREADYRVRRDRLRELLGGDCRCTRCVREERERSSV